jgi:ribose/xylose/arabinose/galactoside ABC-type transport system permease subunit
MKFVRDYGLIALLGFLVVLFGLLNPVFISAQNLLNILDQVSIIGIVALGMTLVILTGGIDLSVGSIVAFTGIILAKALVSGFSVPTGVLLCLATGIALGSINGFFVSYGKLPSFIVTLGLMSAARGATLYLAEGRSISGLPIGLNQVANFNILGITLPALAFILLTIALTLFTKFTYWGKYVYAVGGNERAAWLSGVHVQRYKMFVYVLTGLLCALSAVVLVGKLSSAQSQAGNMYELNAIAAVVIGGTSLSGGKGTIYGTFFGILVLGVLQNGFSILNISIYYQQILLGLIIIVAVYLDKKSFQVE